ncbi:substrate-binding domain-containing protein [Streptomyces sp. NBC_00873]|uniref:substrate-binding domain-containing protein n=1 Tax=unclassified Streptomyces TaxID=2593676 RepID=UPI003865B0C2|nr:substrate-binding domain-containing protein [Streptomyces sp. NBC_00873]WTA42440.1 substrate-binding domain-containing protein [Streptomyces sp. NBC_00842]
MASSVQVVARTTREIGRSAAQLLLDRLEGEDSGPAREIVLAHRLVPRESA